MMRQEKGVAETLVEERIQTGANTCAPTWTCQETFDKILPPDKAGPYLWRKGGGRTLSLLIPRQVSEPQMVAKANWNTVGDGN